MSQNIIKGKVFVLGDNIDTDQIIPAKYLSYDPSNPDEKKYFGKFALFGVPEGESGYPGGDKRFVTEGYASEYKIIIAGESGGGNLTIATSLKLKQDGDIGLISSVLKYPILFSFLEL